jgi:spore maturation protein CgeB
VEIYFLYVSKHDLNIIKREYTNKMKRIFIICDVDENSKVIVRTERYHWLKGLIRLGHDIQIFNYKSALMSESLIRCRTFTGIFAKNKTDEMLAEQVKQYQPDIVLFIALRYLDAQTARKIRTAAPYPKYVARDNDWYPANNKHRIALAKEMDIMIASNAGTWLKDYKDAGVPLCAFLPNPCDPDIQRPYDDPNGKYKTDIIFTGKALHSKNENDLDRYNIMKRLSEMPNARIYGDFGKSKIGGIEAFKAISNAKIGLSINSANDVRLYHSDRFIMYLSCGTFVLAKRVPDTELLFKDGVHLRYFDTTEEFFELADWYLKHDYERKKIAQAGMEHAHKELNCTKIAGHLIDLIEKGTYDAPWKFILK